MPKLYSKKSYVTLTTLVEMLNNKNIDRKIYKVTRIIVLVQLLISVILFLILK